jgi:uncharacterized protein DUF1840
MWAVPPVRKHTPPPIHLFCPAELRYAQHEPRGWTLTVLVRFDSDAGSFSMFGDVAVQLLRMMGHSGTVPSAILAQDIPAALARLKTAVAAEPEPAAPPPEANKDAGSEPKVSLRQRAFPLIELLARADKRGCNVMWRQE